MPLIGFTQEKYSHLLSDKHEIQSHKWWKENYNNPGLPKYGVDTLFITKKLKKLAIITEYQNREGQAIGYWLVDLSDNSTYFRDCFKLNEALTNKSLKIL